MKLQQQEMINATPDEFGRLLHDFSERLLELRKVPQYQKLHVPPFVVLHPCDEFAIVIGARVNAPIQEALDNPPSEYTVLGNPRKATDLYFGSIHALSSGGGQRQTVVTLYYWDQGKWWIEGLWKLLLAEFRRLGLLCEMKIADDDSTRAGRPKVTELSPEQEDKLRRYLVQRHKGKSQVAAASAAQIHEPSPRTLERWRTKWPEVEERLRSDEVKARRTAR